MTTNLDQPGVAQRRLPYFLGGQIVLLGLLLSLGAYRMRVLSEDERLPPLREEPLAIGPLYNDAAVATDEQLQLIMQKLRPRLNGKQTNINYVDHALRMWTSAATFRERGFASGDDLRRVLVDHQEFVRLYGPDRPPLLVDEDNAVTVRTQEGDVSCSHTDHTLASLAEVGTPLSFPIVAAAHTTSYRALLERALHEFSLNQPEYEWTAMLYALFMPEAKRWRTKEGQELTFDRIAERIMREAWPKGVCLGTHRLFTLSVYLRVDEEFHILSADSRVRIVNFLQDATRRLVKNQHPDGFWNDQWAYAQPASSVPSDREGDHLGERMVATGHIVEWWAISPPEIQPPRDVVVKAGQWLVRIVSPMDDGQLRANQVYLTHIGRGLALWRSRTPLEVIRTAESAGAAQPELRVQAAVQPTTTVAHQGR